MSYLKYSIDSLPQEYFERELSHVASGANPGGTLWGALFVNTFFLMATPSVLISPEIFPPYVYWCGMGLCFLLFAYLILCILFGSKKRSRRHLIACMTSSIIGFSLFQLTLWLFSAEMAMIGTCMGMGARIDVSGSIVVMIIALIVLSEGIIINFVMWYKVKQRITEGHYKKGGGGLWGSWNHKDTALAVIASICPVLLSVSRFAVPLGKLWNGEANEALTPIMSIIFPLLLSILFFVFSYGNAMLILRIYCIKKFFC